MPELPDLEVFARNLSRKLIGRKIESAEVHRPKRVRGPEAGIESALAGRKFKRIEREGKEVWFNLDDGNAFSVHLMLDGAFYLTDPDKAPKLRAITLLLDNGRAFGYVDPRGLAILQYAPEPKSTSDALELDLEQFRKVLAAKPRQPIKGLLVDQDAIAGIGNAFADEILWEARVHPASPCGKLPADVAKRLHGEIGKVLRRAVKQIERCGPDWIGGEERGFLKVHVKDRERTDTGHKIRIEEIAGKKTYFTDEQKLYR